MVLLRSGGGIDSMSKTYVRPYKRKNTKSKGKHRVSGHTRHVGNSRRSENISLLDNFEYNKDNGFYKKFSNQLKNKNFVGWVMENGHRHTAKSHGVFIHTNISDKCKSPIEEQEQYLRYVEENENTRVVDVMVADDVNEAIKKNIIKSETDYY